MEIKRIEAIHAIEKKLGELRALIPVYKARCPTYEHVLAKQIINFDLQLIAAKSNQFQTYHFAAFPFEIHQLTLHSPAINLPAPKLVHSNDISGILTERFRLVPNLYWQLIGVPVRTFRQIKYLPLPNAVPDLDQALS